MGDYRTDFTLPDSESKEVSRHPRGRAASRAGRLHRPDRVHCRPGRRRPRGAGGDGRALRRGRRSIDGVAVTSPYSTEGRPAISPDGRSPSPNSRTRPTARRRCSRSSDESKISATRSMSPVWRSSTAAQLFGEFELPASEIFGFLAAVIILILAFGSVLAMGLPIGTAVVRARHRHRRSSASLSATCSRCPTSPPQMAAMIGLGVGIDYALFIVTRYRENLHLGLDLEDADRRGGRHQPAARWSFAGITVDDLAARSVLVGSAFVRGLAIAGAVARAGDDDRRPSPCCPRCSASPGARSSDTVARGDRRRRRGSSLRSSASSPAPRR